MLTLDEGDHPEGRPHLSSASGIARLGHRVYIVADDEHHLAWTEADEVASSPLRLLRFTPGRLPLEGAQRKAHKPDLEVLLHLPALEPGGGDLLVLLGSGSRPQRERAFAMEMLPHGEPAAAPVEVSAAMFYARVREQFGEPNLEAACADGAHVHLFQRANRSQPFNGRVTYLAQEVCAWLRGCAAPPSPVAVRRFSLGDDQGVPFGITDAAPWPGGGCVFTAVAEDTTDAYRDGACLASMVGWMDGQGQVRACVPLAGAPKVEGVTRSPGGRLWLVTDADDPHRPSELLEVDWAP